MAEKLRLGGMALANGVLVHGPTSWACAIRLPDGTLEVAAERKRFVSHEGTPPLLRGPLKLLEAVLALRGSELAAYHGAEHVSIGTYEHGEPRAKEHERCGSHLVGPILLTATLGNVLAAKAPANVRPLTRTVATLGSLAVSTEIFSWMVRHPEHPVARALSRPGHELQHRVGTDEPSAEQLEVANAALRACLALEGE